VKLSHCIFAIRPQKFSSSSLKEIENQLKSFKKFWLRIIWPVPLHSHKNGWQKGQKIFESWEATARLASGETNGKSSEINSI
jgi:hypothetical protein